jgi:ceramide glucosyltransferase
VLLLTFLALLALAPLAVLVIHGGRGLRRRHGPATTPLPAPAPTVGLVVPVKDAPPGMQACLESLLRQDYPDYEVVFAMQDDQDPALAVVRAAQAAVGDNGPTVRTAFAGQAKQCGQKNWNQLAGIAALDCGCAILAFCDSTHVAPPHWLPELVRPIALGESVASTAYHHVFPRERNLASLGRTISVLALYMMQEIPSITQPWGGSMAVSRATFDELEVAAIWGRTVVDDVSLALKLERAGHKATAVPRARMETDLPPETMRDWRLWLQRQWLYLKFLFPGSWIAVGLLLYLSLGLLVFDIATLLLAPLGLLPAPLLLPAGLHLGGCVVLALYSRRAHPAPGRVIPWLVGFLGTLAMAAVSHALTLPAKKISWRGISYQVGREGAVERIERS